VKRRGFSLIELLVVIGIIAILIGILLPTMRGVRERAKAVQCASQMRSLGQAFYNYAAQNHGALPTWSGWQVAGGDGTGDDDPGPGWTEQLAPFYAPPTSRVYDCPSFPDDYPINYFLAARWCSFNHRLNLTLAEIRTSSTFILSGDCTGETLYRMPFGTREFTTDDCDKDDAVGPALTFASDPGGGLCVHHGGNNVLFGDGHVAWFGRFEPQSMTFSPTEIKTWAELEGG
jgi:prepilin-type N-terminal cleavage/methylation domain-containing protein/prepilin-type processing-associated H-X9-DG protein